MADKINPTHYKNMIDALNTFATKTSETSTELSAACGSCIQVLGSDDVAAQKLPANASAIATKYGDLAKMAKSIADAMEDDLEIYYKTIRDWDNASSDDFE